MSPENISVQEAKRRETELRTIKPQTTEEFLERHKAKLARIEAEKKMNLKIKRTKTKPIIRKDLLEAERKNRYVVKENLDYYMNNLETKYGRKTPWQYLKDKTPKEIAKEGKELEKLFTKILARILAVSRNGYEQILDIEQTAIRKDVNDFLYDKNKRRKHFAYMIQNIQLAQARTQALFQKIFKYCKVLQKGKITKWFSGVNEFKDISIIGWISTIERKEMKILRHADHIINKKF